MKRIYSVFHFMFYALPLFIMILLMPLGGKTITPEIRFPQPAMYKILHYLEGDPKTLVYLRRTCRYFRDKVGQAPAILHALHNHTDYTQYLKTVRKNMAPLPDLPEDRLEVIHGLFDGDEEPLEQKHIEPFVQNALKQLAIAFTALEWQKLPPFFKIEHTREEMHKDYVHKLYHHITELYKKGTISDTHYQNCLGQIAQFPSSYLRGTIEMYVLSLDHCPPKGFVLSALARNPTNSTTKLLDYIDAIDHIIGNHEDHDLMVGESLQAKVLRSIIESHRCQASTCLTLTTITPNNPPCLVCPILWAIYVKSISFQSSERIEIYVTILKDSICTLTLLDLILSAYFTLYQTMIAPTDEEIILQYTAILQQPQLSLDRLDTLLRSVITVQENREQKLRHNRTSMTLLPPTITQLHQLFITALEQRKTQDLQTLLRIYNTSTTIELNFQKALLRSVLSNRQ